MTDQPIASIQDRLREALTNKGISQAELSRRTGIPKGSISQYLTGYVKPKQDRIYMMAKALDVDAVWLMGYDIDSNMALSAKPKSVLPVPDLSFLNNVPILGTSACGVPIEANRVYEYLNLKEDMKADFALVAEGKSMTGCGIMDGSLVLFTETPVVDNGDIAAVTIDNSTTIKKFYKYGNTVILRPCNPDFEDQEYSGEELESMHVFGKAVGWITTY